MTKTCICKLCDESPECKVKKLTMLLKRLFLGNERPLILIDYANKTQKELQQSLEFWVERI